MSAESERNGKPLRPGFPKWTIATLATAFVLLSFWIAIPFGFKFAGDQTVEDIDKSNPDFEQAYHKAMKQYSFVRIQPLFRSLASAGYFRVSIELQSVHLSRVTHGKADLDERNRYLEHKGNLAQLSLHEQADPYMQEQFGIDLIGHGRYQDVLEFAARSSHPPMAASAKAAALATGDRDSFEKWVVLEPNDFMGNQPSGLTTFLVAGHQDRIVEMLTTQKASLYEKKLIIAEAHRRAGEHDEAMDILRRVIANPPAPSIPEASWIPRADELPPPLLPQAIESMARSLSEGEPSPEDNDFLRETLEIEPDDDDSFLCSWLALAGAEHNAGNAIGALAAANKASSLARPTFDGYITLYGLLSESFYGCHPELYVIPIEQIRHGIQEMEDAIPSSLASAFETEPGSETPIGVLQHDLASARSRLEVLVTMLALTHVALLDPQSANEAMDVISASTPQATHVRVLAHEIKGNWDEARRIAKLGFAQRPHLLNHALARIAFKSGDIDTATELLSEFDVDNYQYPESILIETSAMQLMLGNEPSFPIPDERIDRFDPTSLDDDVKFRSWFTSSVRRSDPPRSIQQFIVPTLHRWRGAEREGTSLLDLEHFGSFYITFRGSLVSAHIRYMDALARDDIEQSENHWRTLENVRSFFIDEPIWRFLERPFLSH